MGGEKIKRCRCPVMNLQQQEGALVLIMNAAN